jgi:PAS domain S-box-containing protein
MKNTAPIDIEVRKRAGEEQTPREPELGLIIDTIPALAWSARPDGSAEFFNQQYLAYVGLPLDQLQGSGWTVAVHPDDLSALAASWPFIMSSGEAVEAEARLRRFDGEYRWFLFRANPMRDESGEIIKWLGISTDIEDRKRSEEALQSAEHNLSLIINTIPAHIYVLNTEGFVQHVNQAVMDYTGLTVEDVQQQDYRDRVIHPDDFKRFRAVRAESLRRTAQFSTE